MVPEQVKAFFSPDGKIKPVEFTTTTHDGSLVHIKINRIIKEWREELDIIRVFECESILYGRRQVCILEFNTASNLWRLRDNELHKKAN